MAYKVNALPDYVASQGEELLAKSILTPKTISLIDKMTGVKYQDAMDYLDVVADFQDGSECGFSADGSATFSQRIMEVAPIKINAEYCEKSLIKKWTQREVITAANGQDRMPFEVEISSEIADGIKAKLEKAVWQGDKASSDKTLKHFDGFLKKLKAEEGVIKQTITATSVNATNIVKTIEAAYMGIPAEIVVKDNCRIMVGIDLFRIYQMALVAKNLYHFDGVQTGEFEVIIPGTNVKVIGLDGLNGTNAIVAGALDNFVYGTDLEGDDESFDLWYSKDDRNYKLAVEFKAGVQVKFPSEILLASIAG